MAYHPNEIIAFNIVYRRSNAPEIFKEVYRRSGSAGKFYALIGLFLKKDPNFETLKNEFLNAPQNPVDVQYGCKGSANNDVKSALKTWLEGIPNGLWVTKILLDQK
jgi:hypothetical protein